MSTLPLSTCLDFPCKLTPSRTFAGCRDIDDALHCTALPNGNFEIGVRILRLAHCRPL